MRLERPKPFEKGSEAHEQINGIFNAKCDMPIRDTLYLICETMPCWGKKIAQRIASWTWDVTHERALSPADLFGGKAPVGALIGLLERIR